MRPCVTEIIITFTDGPSCFMKMVIMALQRSWPIATDMAGEYHRVTERRVCYTVRLLKMEILKPRRCLSNSSFFNLITKVGNPVGSFASGLPTFMLLAVHSGGCGIHHLSWMLHNAIKRKIMHLSLQSSRQTLFRYHHHQFLPACPSL